MIAPLTIAQEIDPTRRSSRSNVMYVYLLRTLSIQIFKTKLMVKMPSESGRFANLTEEDLSEMTGESNCSFLHSQLVYQ